MRVTGKPKKKYGWKLPVKKDVTGNIIAIATGSNISYYDDARRPGYVNNWGESYQYQGWEMVDNLIVEATLKPKHLYYGGNMSQYMEFIDVETGSTIKMGLESLEHTLKAVYNGIFSFSDGWASGGLRGTFSFKKHGDTIYAMPCDSDGNFLDMNAVEKIQQEYGG